MENQQPINQEPQLNTPPEQPNQLQSPQPFLRRWFPTIAGIVIVVFIGGGVLAYQTWWSEPSESTTQEQPAATTPTELPGIEDEVVEDEIASWKTYRNEKFGYEVKYPQDWEVSDLNIYSYISKGKYDEAGVTKIGIYPNGNGRGLWGTETRERELSFSSISGSIVASRMDFLTKNGDTFASFLTFDNTSVGDYDWDSEWSYILVQADMSDMTFESTDGFSIRQIAKGTPHGLGVAEQILSTFKFID